MGRTSTEFWAEMQDEEMNRGENKRELFVGNAGDKRDRGPPSGSLQLSHV